MQMTLNAQPAAPINEYAKTNQTKDSKSHKTKNDYQHILGFNGVVIQWQP